jgi:tRNA(Ile)-lysidine synthase
MPGDLPCNIYFVPQALDRRVLDYIRRHALLRPGDRAAVAVSGGADSVALLRLMLSLCNEVGIVLSIAHFNHKIRGEASDADEQFVRDLALTHGLELHASSGDTPAHAQGNKLSLETAARELRYSFFRELISSGTVSKLMTAHTLDDQAETVLLRIVRGTGTAGLAGIYPEIKVPVAVPHVREANVGSIIRPLLAVQRCEIEDYLRSLGQPWREDATNADVKHTRNRVRHLLLPLIEREFNPAARGRLSELAEIARADEEDWQSRLSELTPKVLDERDRIRVTELGKLSLALQRRVLREAGRRLGTTLDFETVDSVQRIASAGQGMIELPGGFVVRCVIERRPSGGRSGVFLVIEKADSSSRYGNYEYALKWPGKLALQEAEIVIRAELVSGSDAHSSGKTPWHLLDPRQLNPELTVRNWRPGDRFWPSGTSKPKKVKELLQEKHVTGAERAFWPVIMSDDRIVWLRGFPVAEGFRPADDSVPALAVETSTF